MKMRDRMTRANPVLRALVDRIDDLISGHNELVRIVMLGKNPHKANDITNVVTTATATGSAADPVIDLSADLRTQYEAHRADTGAHASADSTNTITATTVQAKIKALADELKLDVNAHMAEGATVHTNDDDVTPVVAAADMTTKASGITLINQIRAAYEAHRVRLLDVAAGAVHGAADATNVVTPAALATAATWTEMAALVDAIRVAYEAHRVLTGGSEHGSADSTNTVTAAAVGTVQTTVNTLADELKADLNAHLADAAHYTVDRSMLVTAANATTLATSRTLVNAIKESYADHITRADQAATAPIVATLDEE